MFTIDQTITAQMLREKNLMRVYFSMNNHQVATPEMMLEEARSYILFFRETGARASAFIALHLLQTDRKLIYRCSSNVFPESELDAVREEALGFVEGLGAMLDEVDFLLQSSAERSAWLDSQEMFAHKPEVKAPEKQPEEISPKPAAAVSEQAGKTSDSPAPEERLAAATPAPPQPVPVSQAPVSSVEQAPVPSPPAAPPAQPSQPVQSALPAAQQNVQHEPAVVISPEVVIEEQPAPASRTADPPVSPPKDTRKAGARATAAAARVQENRHIAEEPAAPAPEADAQGILSQAIKAGIVKPPKTTLAKDIKSAAGVVSRDREALARLLTSF